MEESLKRWLFDPTGGRLIAAVVGLIVVYVVHRILQRTVGRYVAEPTNRYRARKFSTFIAYLLAAGLLAASFSERLAGLTVAFGVAGAGIAFALQEVIASVAGWIAISFGSFYSPGDRVQLGGSKAMSSTLPCCVPPLWRSANRSTAIFITDESYELRTALYLRSRCSITRRISRFSGTRSSSRLNTAPIGSPPGKCSITFEVVGLPPLLMDVCKHKDKV